MSGVNKCVLERIYRDRNLVLLNLFVCWFRRNTSLRSFYSKNSTVAQWRRENGCSVLTRIWTSLVRHPCQTLGHSFLMIILFWLFLPTTLTSPKSDALYHYARNVAPIRDDFGQEYVDSIRAFMDQGSAHNQSRLVLSNRTNNSYLS